MAELSLTISAKSAEDLNRTISDLAGFSTAPKTVTRAVEAEPEPGEVINSEAANNGAEAVSGRRPRGPNKSKIDAPAAELPAEGVVSSASDTGTATEAGSAGTGATTSSATLADVQGAATKFMSPEGGGSQLQAQELLKANFKTGAGEPVTRFSQLQAGDYGACVDLFAAQTKGA